jgi:hypothetical protein
MHLQVSKFGKAGLKSEIYYLKKTKLAYLEYDISKCWHRLKTPK